MNDPLKNITNYVPLTNQFGTSGQPTRDQFQDIKDAGYGAVINLALPSSDHAIADEGSVVTSLGMTYVHIPVDFAHPTLEDLNRFVGAAQALSAGNGKVWVHCVVNARVSAFMYKYLHDVQGVDATLARSPILDKWQPQMDEVWRNFLDLDVGSNR